MEIIPQYNKPKDFVFYINMSMNVADLFTNDWNITHKDNVIVCSKHGYELDVFEIIT
jgi:hypothetical protein